MDLSAEIHAFVKSHIGDRACFLGDLDLPLQIVAQGRRDDVLQNLLQGIAPFGIGKDTLIDDNED
jgi:hypothetical protein